MFTKLLQQNAYEHNLNAFGAARKIIVFMVSLLVVTGVSGAQDPHVDMLHLDPNLTSLGLGGEPFGYGSPEKAWPRDMAGLSRISVCWRFSEKNEQFDDDRKLVKEVVAETWATAANILFTGWGNCDDEESEVRILIDDTTPGTLGLGTDVKGKDGVFVLNFAMSNWQPSAWCLESDDNRKECLRAVAVHEFGHVLGLAHEQNKSDVDVENCHEMPSGPNGSQELTPWDALSVMNYCNPIYKDRGWQLSEKDVVSIQALYGAR